MYGVKICPECFQKNDALAPFCSNCHASLDKAEFSTVAVSGSVPTLPDMRADNRMEVLPHQIPDGHLALLLARNNDIVFVPLAQQIVLGRQVLDDPMTLFLDLSQFGAAALGVSRQHVALENASDGFYVQDLNSSNGTWVNATRLTPAQPQPLRDGDLLRLGQMALYVYFKTPGTGEQTFLLMERDDLVAALPQHPFAPALLMAQIGPFLRAIGELQSLIDELLMRKPQPVGIRSLSLEPNRRQLRVALENSREAVSLIRKDLVNWRKQYNADLVRLHEVQLLLQQSSYLASEQRADAEQARYKLEQLRLDIRQSLQAIAQQWVEELYNARLDEGTQVAQRFVSPMQVIALSTLDMLAQG